MHKKIGGETIVIKIFVLLFYAAENSEAADFSKERRYLIAVVLPLVTTGMLIICALGYFLWKRLRKQGIVITLAHLKEKKKKKKII